MFAGAIFDALTKVHPGVLATLAATVAACTPFADTLAIDSIEPPMGPSTMPVDVSLHGLFAGQFRADVDTGAAGVLPLALTIHDSMGATHTLAGRLVDDATIATTVPAGLPQGAVAFEVAFDADTVTAADKYAVYDPPLGPWGAPTPLFTSGTADDDPTFTGDLLEVYFNRNSDIYVSTRAAVGAAWSTPMLVPGLSSSATETTPEITSDGLTIFIASGRAGGLGADDIWMATRADRASAWSTPVHVPELSSSVEDAASAPTDDLRAIVFISPRAGGVGLADIYASERTQTTAPWGTPVNLTSINTAADDFSPMLSQDRRTLYWDAATAGTSDLYMATRASTAEPFGTAMPITELDTAGAENDPWVSPDQHHIAFVRDGVLYEASR